MAVSSSAEFEEIECLKEGKYGKETLVKRKVDDSKFVVKKVNLNKILEPKFSKMADEEAKILVSLHHPNIIRIHNHFCESTAGSSLFYHLVVEHCDGGTLEDEIERLKSTGGFFSENHILWWSTQLTSALKFIHSKKLVHQNIRPNNIYLVNGNRDVKLGEFGFVRHDEIDLEAPEPETACSLSYLSPEFLAGDHEFCPKCDLWAMGVCLFYAVSQKMPQDHNSIKMGFPPKSSNCYSKELLQYIRWSLSSDDNERPETVDELAHHPLLNEHRVNQIRTVFDLPLPISKKSSRVSEDDFEPWQFHGRASTISATKPWISALVDVKSKNYILAISYCGQVTALTKAGDHVLWSKKIVADGARGGIWHAAIDEKRGRLLITYNGTADPVNVFPVDVYAVRLADLEAACTNAKFKPVELTTSSEESDEVSDDEIPAAIENEVVSSDESVASSFSVVDSNHSGHKSVASSKASSKHSEANSVNSKHSTVKSNKSDKSEVVSQKSDKSKKSETKSNASSKNSSNKSKGNSSHSIPVSAKLKKSGKSSSTSSRCSSRTSVSKDGLSVVKAELFFHHDEWRCSGLRIDVENDHLYICDWFGNKIGIWNLKDIEPETDPIHVIGKPEQFKHFNPTRCDIIPIIKASKENDPRETLEPKVQYLAVSDWLRSRVYLFKTTAIKDTINHEFEATITSKGNDVGMVATPIDIQCDPTARTLIVCDQNNNRAQLFIPDPEWPDFKAVATENLGGHFSAVAITQDHESSASDNIRVLLAGMNTGEVIAFKFKNA